MDWARAKTILIVTFFLLNIFLFIAILYTNSGLRFQSEYTRYAKEFLESRRIRIDTRIPEIRGKAEIINYSSREYDLDQLSEIVFGYQASKAESESSILISEGNESISIQGDVLTITDELSDGIDLFNDQTKFSQRILEYLNNIGYQKDTLNLQTVEETDKIKRVKYLLKYKNGLLFDQEIIAELSSVGVLSLSLTAKEAKQTNSPNPYEIMSAYQVLVMGNLPEGSVIQNMDFGYRKIGQDELYDSPVWRVVLSNGTTMYFNADTGEKLQ